ncbi:MAG: HIT family protein [Nanoarchaeota archaeon]|nr:HIT family protein [Nanoarchaeota archaeon]MBU1703827.1 HIT family protein [Nanoarchaeota archaeon]
MEACIFCKIVKGEIPCEKIYEDEDVISFLDIGPVSKGHALVVTKEHYETLLDVPEKLEKAILNAVKKVARAQSSVLGNDGFNVLFNNKKVAGQVVPHVHAHVIPRKANDGIRFEWIPRKYPGDEMKEYGNNLRKFL